MEQSGFFNSNNGDRIYDATDFAAYFGDLVSNGVFYRDTDNLKIVAGAGMGVTAQPGSGWINGYHYKNTAPLDLQLATADGVNPRIDRVVLRWSNVNRAVNLAIKAGTSAAVPTPADLERSADIYELALADILVQRGAVAITDDVITDQRLNTALCGLVNSLVAAVYE